MTAKSDDDVIPPPLCVFCSAPWTDEMLTAQARTEIENGYYEGEYYIQSADVTLDVACSTCKRLVYRKEIRGAPNEKKW